MEFKRVFVTGGSGFLGRNLIRRLVSDLKLEVVAIARSEKAAKEIEQAGGKPIVGVDVNDVAKLQKAASGCEVAVHCAGSVAMMGRNFEPSRIANVIGTKNVITACRSAGLQRVVHISTENCFLTGKPLRMADETLPFPPEGANYGPYSTTKKEAEILAKQMNGDGIEVVIVRPRMVWGGDDSVVLPELAANVASGRMRWFDGGNYLTSTVHIQNCCHGIVCALKNGKPGESYYVSDGAPVQFKKFFTEMLSAAGVRDVDKIKDIPLSLAWAAATFLETIGVESIVNRGVLATIGMEVTVNDAKARKEIGYSNIITMEQGMADLRERYSKKPII